MATGPDPAFDANAVSTRGSSPDADDQGRGSEPDDDSPGEQAPVPSRLYDDDKDRQSRNDQNGLTREQPSAFPEGIGELA